MNECSRDRITCIVLWAAYRCLALRINIYDFRSLIRFASNTSRMQLSRLTGILLLALFVCFLFSESDGWRRRRRRRRRSCTRTNCAVNNWSSWSRCNARCGKRGYRYRYRSKYRSASCGGSCNLNNNLEYTSCNGPCCRVK